VKLEA